MLIDLEQIASIGDAGTIAIIEAARQQICRYIL